MITELLLIRHGETEWNKLGRFQGCAEVNLTQKGMDQAKYLANRINGNFDFIYTSPLGRARKTSEILSKNTGKIPIVLNDLREIDYGKWEGLTTEEIIENYKDEYYDWRNDPRGPLCGGDLSIQKVCERAKNAILPVMEKRKGKKVIMVAHGGIIRAALVALFNWELDMYHRIVLLNTSVCKLSFDENLGPIIVTLNDTSHLEEPLKVPSYEF